MKKWDYRKDKHGSMLPPKHGRIYESVAYGFSTFEEGEAIFAGEKKGYAYSRMGNPTVRRLEEEILTGEATGKNGYDCLVTNSGMSAISLVAIALTAHENHKKNFVYSPAIYGGVYDLFSKLVRKLGIEARMVAPEHMHDANKWSKYIDENTEFIYIETPSNPQCFVFNIEDFARLAQKKGVFLVVDNTLSTFVEQLPLTWGADIVVYSTTKGINGYGNAMGGAIVGPDMFINGNPDDPEDGGIRFGWAGELGTAIDPSAAHRTLLGMKDIYERIPRASENAFRLMEMLSEERHVEKVYYSLFGQPTPSNHQMKDGGCLLGFELTGGLRSAQKFINIIASQYGNIFHGPHLGAHMTMVCHPASTTHSRVEEGVRQKLHITDSFIRVSAGHEKEKDFNKVIKNFQDALAQL